LKAADLAGASEETLNLIVQESDKRIAAQVQLLIAKDSRSNTLLSASAALAAAAFGVAASQATTQGYSPLVLGSIAFAVFAAAAAVAAVVALWPVNIELQGWSPRLFKEDVAISKPHKDVLTEVAAFNEQKIAGNDKANKTAASRATIAMALLAAAPIAGSVAAALKAFWPCGAT
jgi:hypothetical protein